MKRITLFNVFFACGLLATSVPAFAQNVPAEKPPQPSEQPAPAAPAEKPANWFNGHFDVQLLGRDVRLTRR